ncbi:MAG: hypothetical protein KGZ39_00880 [Simkania sp.]|nr:hypothetical protein [Simkania sp.]
MITKIPVVNTLYQWWDARIEKQELHSLTALLEKSIKKTSEVEVRALTEKTIQLLDHCKGNPVFKREMASLERSYFVFLKAKGKYLPKDYLAQENRDFVELFSKMGISSAFMRTHPEFLTIARQQFWQHYFPFVKLPVRMVGNELYLPLETKENTGRFHWKSWSEIQSLQMDHFRITYQGFAIGHADQSKHLVPLKTVEAQGKYALQFVTACPVGRALPSSISFMDSGHSFTQIILPKRDGDKAEVYSVGYYPRKLADFGMQLFKTVPGVYRNHDSNVSRIQAKQVIPIIKQYVLTDDYESSPCLYSLVQNMKPVCKALKEQGYKFGPITMDHIDKAMIDRNEPELDRILIGLTEIRELIVKNKIIVDIPIMSRKEKTLTIIKRFEQAQGKHTYHMLGANCTAASYRQEAFAVAFLDAKLDPDRAIRIFDSQVDIRDHRVGIVDRIGDIVARIFLHFFAALPLTGPILGNGSTHPDAVTLSSRYGRLRTLVPSVLSETAFATHQMLTAPFTSRPLFPAGEILSHSIPIIEPPSLWARLRYLWHRDSLLKQPHT